jgi:uncharacterized protein (DUF362 family)
MVLATIEFRSYHKSVAAAFDKINAGSILAQQAEILIKPNLINDSPHPVTTAVDCCEAVIEYVRSFSTANIVIGEGCGDAILETDDIFDSLGYRDLAERHDVGLVDLNISPLTKLENRQYTVFPEFYLPEIALTHFIISLPVLKAHSLSIITGTMKNMIGLAPPQHYSGGFGGWKKSVFHQNMHQAIVELNRYRSPDLSLMDASVGLADFHLGGRHCSPPLNKIIAGYNPLEVDRQAAELLGLNWEQIPHLSSKTKLGI